MRVDHGVGDGRHEALRWSKLGGLRPWVTGCWLAGVVLAASPSLVFAGGRVVLHGGSEGRGAVADWASGYWKGSCAAGEAVTGLSSFPQDGAAHAAYCNGTDALAADATAGVHTTGSTSGGMRLQPAGSGNLVDCGPNELITGLSQSTTGVFQGLRCTRATGQSTFSCETRVLPGGVAYTGAFGDWDPGHYKAECTGSKVAVGVFVSGGKPQALVCCGVGQRGVQMGVTLQKAPVLMMVASAVAVPLSLPPFGTPCTATPVAGEAKTFTVACGSATWKMTSESGEVKSDSFELTMPIGTADPAVKLAEALAKSAPASAAMALALPRTVLAGMLTFTEAELALNAKSGFHVKGKLSIPAGFGSSSLAKVKLLPAAIKGAAKLLGLAGSVNVPAELSLASGSNELDLALKLTMVETMKISPSLFPVVNTRAAFNKLEVSLHGKMPMLGGTPSISFETAGTFYLQLTQWDDWMKINLAIEPEIGAEGPIVTFGGAFSGSCGKAEPTVQTTDENCRGMLNPFGANLITARGGLLKLAFNAAGEPVALTAGDENASVRGWPVGDLSFFVNLDLKNLSAPAGGVYVFAPKVPLTAILGTLPFAREAPFSQLLAMADVLPPFENVELFLSPTGLNTETFTPPKTPYKERIDLTMPGVALRGKVGPLTFQGLAQGNLHALFSGQLAVAGHAMINLDLNDLNERVKDGARRIPVLGPVLGEILSLFKFNRASAKVTVRAGVLSGAADLSFTLFGQTLSPSVAFDLPLRPDLLVAYVLEKIKSVATDVGKLILKGLEIAGKAIADGTTRAASEVAKAAGVVGDGIVTAAKVVGQGFEYVGASIAKLFESPRSRTIMEQLWEIAGRLGGRVVLDLAHYQTKYAVHIADGQWTAGKTTPAGGPFGIGQPLSGFKGDERALVHWIYEGSSAGYEASPWFEPLAYMNANPDVTQALRQQHPNNLPAQYQGAAEHFAQSGLNEGRLGGRGFSAAYYLFKHLDVAQQAGYAAEGHAGALRHYREFGRGEKRAAAPSLLPDLAKVPGVSGSVVCRVLRGGRLQGGFAFDAGSDLDCRTRKTVVQRSGGGLGQAVQFQSVDGNANESSLAYEVLRAGSHQWIEAKAARPAGQSYAVVALQDGVPSLVCGVGRTGDPRTPIPGSTVRNPDGSESCVVPARPDSPGQATRVPLAQGYMYLVGTDLQWVIP